MDDVEFFPAAESIPGTKMPFSEAVRVGNVLYLSGAIGLDANGKVVPGGIGPETRQALDNVAAVLDRHGSEMDRVFKVTVMLADIGEWAAMNTVYRTYFPTEPPARATVGVAALAADFRVEIEVTAAR